MSGGGDPREGTPAPGVQRSIRGRRPAFFEDREVDRLHGMLMAMATEMAVLYERLDTLERVAAGKGLVPRAELEAHAPDAAAQAEREAWRQRFLGRLFYLYREELDDRLSREDEAQYRQFLDDIAARKEPP